MATTNTGKKDAKGRIIFRGPRGGEFVRTATGRKSKPAVGRLTKKQLEEKAKVLSAKRQFLNSKAKNLSAKRQMLERGAEFLNQEASRLQAENTMRRLDKIVKNKASNVRNMTKKM
ncbi:PBCV-specific basic adaptor domain-containing protein [Paramecium bursaria Chlorella virus NY2B]|uniref:Uncharacterized protein B765R n=2 Tax=Chlorovirus TaxID=181083 RepID=A7IXU0_PBCVN|nr:hypothetical protein NY2A_B765R [Paramecium bursaria Chlorella virus NY2A]YP_001498772.1 hypothetical protein AR158_C691R [Paramecium bursaria Chlorella virus AR158]YP_009665531.1 PBCV-specific basic adaptor domain-containing protein [Paramecium bursaria Chlorella virus NYs1]AGE54388.1 PBCV-specific basic adaptor domain-containing protein [Paramecium bursaria Chlorella virus IL-5-2s1]AGE58506.1 PBCV-specific basic adaptor domain-containing protein [Paramecium bursaria Chlorella virus NY2B]A